jgi:hypothetical protein
MVTHLRHGLAIAVLAHGGDTNVANRSLELDQGMCLVVWVRRARLAPIAEIRVVADGTLVSNALDVAHGSPSRGAERTIAADTKMSLFTCSLRLREGLIDWSKSVTRVNEAGIGHAGVAIIPVRTVKTLVTDTIDVLVAPIAKSVMPLVAASLQTILDLIQEESSFHRRNKHVLRVMAMNVFGEAGHTQIRIVTIPAV